MKGINEELEEIVRDFHKNQHVPWREFYVDVPGLVALVRDACGVAHVSEKSQDGLLAEEENEDLLRCRAKFVRSVRSNLNIVDNFFMENMEMYSSNVTLLAPRVASYVRGWNESEMARDGDRGREYRSNGANGGVGEDDMEDVVDTGSISVPMTTLSGPPRGGEEKDLLGRGQSSLANGAGSQSGAVGGNLMFNSEEMEDMQEISMEDISEVPAGGEQEANPREETLALITETLRLQAQSPRVSVDRPREGEDDSVRAHEFSQYDSGFQKSLVTTCRYELRQLYENIYNLQQFRALNLSVIQKLAYYFEMGTGQPCAGDIQSMLTGKAMWEKDVCRTLLEDLDNMYTNLNFFEHGDHQLHDLFQPKSRGSAKAKPPSIIGGIVVGVTVLLASVIVLLSLSVEEEQSRPVRCCALLLFVTLFWVFEPIPFFVTGLCIPVATVSFFILADSEGNLLDASEASSLVYSTMFNSTTALVLGGFSIALAFSKCKFEVTLASELQKRFGSHPYYFVVAFMFLGFFLSAWISNVAAPVLLSSIFLPVIRQFPTDSKYTRTLLLGLAFACNIGGMLTPIASPQNAVTVSYINANHPEYAVSFFEWMSISVPFCSAAFILVCSFLLLVIRPDDVQRIPPIRAPGVVWSMTHYFVIAISLSTIALWISLPWTGEYIGNMGNIGFLPLVIFLSTGIITKEDFEQKFSWNLIFLLCGGDVLGLAVRNSGVLDILANEMEVLLVDMSPLAAVFIVATMVAIITSFVSHTVAAIILIPVVVEVGIIIGAPQTLYMTTILMDSGSMTLPMTSFPNVNSMLLEDARGQPYLRVKDFVQYGGPITLMIILLLSTFGFVLMEILLNNTVVHPAEQRNYGLDYLLSRSPFV